MNLDNIQVPTGTVKQFGCYGVPYLVGDVVDSLPNGDKLVKIFLLQSGEEDVYRCLRLLLI